jgi:hypothetical protein
MNQPSNAIETYIAQVEQTPFFGGEHAHLSLAFMIRYYRSRIPRRRWGFILIALAIIAINGLNAFLASRGNLYLDSETKDTVITVLSLLAAACAAVNGLFRYETAWGQFTASLFALEHIRRRWETAKANARTASEAATALESLKQMAWQVQEDSQRVTTEEMRVFFENRRLPELIKP